ncbi:hypothetical protein GCM10022223_38910 [Kineosporia mesophila]|uniref:NACHT domain-containing protein n=1 Tax=Kineosporia mesophila TaxID=566012 RepID=A0ABP6ZS61_9ACTN|nr:NACHT domain-containing protein [Kineosporia mesophila]MCD5348517.1 NACHT domain-containing protein [Kineosporia mesophila]
MAIIEGLLLDIGTEVLMRMVEVRGSKYIKSGKIADLLSQGLSIRDGRKAERQLQMVAEEVTEKLEHFIEVEARGVPENELEAMLQCVLSSFRNEDLDLQAMIKSDLDAVTIEKLVLSSADPILKSATLDPRAEAVFTLVVRECSNYLIELATALPSLQGPAFREVLQRETQLLEMSREILNRLPESEADNQNDLDDEFELKYRRAIARKWDHLLLFGIQLDEYTSSRYPLTVAYISLSGTTESDLAVEGSGGPEGETCTTSASTETNPQNLAGDEADRLEYSIAESPRFLIKGEAGSGKTTLLQWLAVGCVRRSFEEEKLSSLNNLIPVLLQLRLFVGKQLPNAEELVKSTLPMLANHEPAGWMKRQLDRSRVIFLIDGLDEFPETQRHDFEDWISEIDGLYPDCRIVITSRPAAVINGWRERLGYSETELLPMTPTDIDSFISHWHEAVRVQGANEEESKELREYENELKRRVATTPSIRSLATSPLLCAMLCALNRDRKTQLPEDRLELYRISLETLLDRRDVERKISTNSVKLNYQQKLLILQDLALWMAQSDQSDADIPSAQARLAVKLAVIRKISYSPSQLLQYLILRSGVIREPSAGRIDFIHRTFLEYLAAREIVEQEQVPLLLHKSGDDQWREVIVLASGHSNGRQRADLINGLLDLGNKDEKSRHRLHLLAVACLETATELDKNVERAVNKVMRSLVPPQNYTDARALASAGDLASSLLSKTPTMTATVAAACIRALGLIGTPKALEKLAAFGNDNRKTVSKELVRAWSNFPLDSYADQVMSKFRSDFEVSDIDQVGALKDHATSGKLKFLAPFGQSIDFSVIEGYRGRIEINARHVQVSNADVLCSLGQLEALDLTRTSGIEDFAFLEGLERLTRLRLSNLNVSNVENLPPALRNLVLLATNSLSSLNGLEKVPNLNFLQIASHALTDAASVSSLRNLRGVVILASPDHCPEVSFTTQQLTSWVHLNYITMNNWDWLRARPRVISLNNVKGEAPSWPEETHRLGSLTLMRSPWDLQTLQIPNHIENLRIERTPVSDLSWLPSRVTSLTLAYCSDLRDLDGLERIQGLRELAIGPHDDLVSLAAVNNVEGLRSLRIDSDLLDRLGEVLRDDLVVRRVRTRKPEQAAQTST